MLASQQMTRTVPVVFTAVIDPVALALPRVATEMAPHVLAYNLTRVISIMGVRPLLAAMRA